MTEIIRKLYYMSNTPLTDALSETIDERDFARKYNGLEDVPDPLYTVLTALSKLIEAHPTSWNEALTSLGVSEDDKVRLSHLIKTVRQ